MSKKKPAKKSGKKKPVSRKKLNRRKKPIQKKVTHSKGPSSGPSAQIHQGVGTAEAEAAVSTNDVSQSDVKSEYEGES